MNDFGPLAEAIYRHKYSLDGKERWADTARRVGEFVTTPLPHLTPAAVEAITSREFLPAGRYLYAAGRPYAQMQNCCLFRVKDSRDGWAELLRQGAHSLMTGMGDGVVYSDIRGKNTLIAGMGGLASGPVALMQMLNEAGRFIRQGGSRRTALWAGLHWWHPDIFDFIHIKDWPRWMREKKEEDFNFPAPMDGTNISVILEPEFYIAYYNPNHPLHEHAHKVFWDVVRQGCSTGEPGFSNDPPGHEDECLRNACTEVVSRDSGDVCNLGSINLARVPNLRRFRELVRLGTGFLLAGTITSAQPLPLFEQVRDQNRRIGLGLMGIHEWLLVRGKRYGPDKELAKWLDVYRYESDQAAAEFAQKLGVAVPVAKRAIAPTGTIAIIGETTGGIEPVLSVAFLRRYLKGDTWYSQYAVDAAAQRIIDRGVNPDAIEDAYDLAKDPERRVAFQAWVQKYVDQGISSTINLPPWGSPDNNELTVRPFGEMLLRYLPKLRGITMYPDGARGGQPITKVRYQDAVGRVGVEFVENTNEHSCANGVCGA